MLTLRATLVVWLMAAASGAWAATLEVGKAAPTISETLALANDGDTVVVPAGVWKGAIVIRKRVVLKGRGAVIDGQGKGTAVRIAAPGVIIDGLTIKHSGKDVDGPDACVYVEPHAEGSQLIRSTLEDCGFGIWVHKTKKVKVEHNRIVGQLTGHRAERGNAIHLFDAEHLTINDNTITGGRDGIYVSATENSVIKDNHVTKTRYCVHYMYSHGNKLLRNSCRDNSHGYALMESRRIHVEGNRSVANEGHGILFRTAAECTILDNVIERCEHGMFLYSSTENLIARNTVRGNQIGAKIWAGSVKNRVTNNRFIANKTQIFYVGGKDLVWGLKQAGNTWSDYLGWDHNGDGYGDRPYRVNSFANSLIARYPAALLLMRSPALEMLQLLESRMPIFRTPTLVDMRPVTRAVEAR